MPLLGVHNFHIPLPAEVYQELKMEAKKSKKTATELIRQAIRSWLAQRKKTALYQQISQYASQNAGTSIDLDKDLEEAAIEHILNSGETL